MNSANSPTPMLPQSSLTQAAIVIKSLPRWQAANLLSRLRAEDCVKVLEAVSEIDQVTSSQLTESLNKLRRDSVTWQSDSKSSGEPPLLIDRRSSRGRLEDGSTKPFAYLIPADAQLRIQLLENEHPRNIALILSSLPAEVASSCLGGLDPTTRVSVIRRMCEQDEINSSELNELNYILKLRHQKLFRRQNRKSSGIRVAVELLSYVDAATQQSILGLLEQSEPELAQQLEYSFFSLDDLLDLDDAEIKVLLTKVDSTHWAPALKRAAFPLQQKILDNLAAGPRKMLSQQILDLKDLDPVLEQQAQRKIIKEALGLAK